MRCGWVARPELFEDGTPSCVDCGSPLVELDVAYARRLVSNRRRADERRLQQRVSEELGLSRADRDWPETDAKRTEGGS